MDELRLALDSLDIEYFLDAEGIVYRRTRGSHGVQLNVRECPFCGGSGWKVYINAETGLGNCFHGDCQTKFNKWKFINAVLPEMKYADLTEYIKKLASDTGWRPKRQNKAQENVFANTRFFMPEMVDIGQAIRQSGGGFPAAKYLLDRGITLESIEYFKLGDCVDGYFQYKTPTGSIGYQDYRGRIIIPIFDREGKTVTFQGRDYTGLSDKRYLFPPGLNSSGTLLYNGWNYDLQRQIIITEGVFDCIAVRQAILNDPAFVDVLPVATFGKHLSLGENSQLSYLKWMKEQCLEVVTFMWDGENAAIRDAVNSALILYKEGFITRVAILPKDKDPNECTPEEVRRAFWEAKPITPKTAIQILLEFQ